jgi:hypothetical protein
MENPQEKLPLASTMQKWTYGTVGYGVDMPRLVHICLSQANNFQNRLPGRPQAEAEIGTPWKVKHGVLNNVPVDALVIDRVPVEVWMPWIRTVKPNNLPQTIIWSGAKEEIVEEDNVQASKVFWREMEWKGYNLTYRMLSAEEQGAAMSQDRLFLIRALRERGAPKSLSEKTYPLGA